jgi:Heterokaryon incompatibility protein (HET)
MASYKYSQFNRLGEVRLLKICPESQSSDIECTLVHVSLDVIPRYNALSYTWGDPALIYHVSCDGKDLRVTKNLRDTLFRLRQFDENLLWIDAVCIDQSNIQERNQQVLLMRQI